MRAEGFSLYKVASEIIDARDEETGLTKLMVHATRGIKDECKHLIVQGANLVRAAVRCAASCVGCQVVSLR